MLKHPPSGISLTRVARWIYKSANAERVCDDDRARLIKRAHIQLYRDDKPIVTVSQGKLYQEHAQQIGWTSIHRAKVDLSIFEFPESRGRHPAEAYGRRNCRARDFRRDAICSCADRRWIGIKGVPVKVSFIIFRRRQDTFTIAKSRRHRKGIFHPFRIP